MPVNLKKMKVGARACTVMFIRMSRNISRYRSHAFALDIDQQAVKCTPALSRLFVTGWIESRLGNRAPPFSCENRATGEHEVLFQVEEDDS